LLSSSFLHLPSFLPIFSGRRRNDQRSVGSDEKRGNPERTKREVIPPRRYLFSSPFPPSSFSSCLFFPFSLFFPFLLVSCFLPYPSLSFLAIVSSVLSLLRPSFLFLPLFFLPLFLAFLLSFLPFF
jgi:hypothetical protein